MAERGPLSRRAARGDLPHEGEGESFCLCRRVRKRLEEQCRQIDAALLRSDSVALLQPADAPANSTPIGVGYELGGDSLKLVVAPAGLRPTEISDKNNQELIICKRKGL